MIDRREFAAGLLALGAACAKSTHAQTSSPAPLKPISSGIVKPGAVKESQNGHSGQSFLTGLLAAGNIRLEAHESVQKPGAPPRGRRDPQAQRDLVRHQGRRHPLHQRRRAPHGNRRRRHRLRGRPALDRQRRRHRTRLLRPCRRPPGITPGRSSFFGWKRRASASGKARTEGWGFSSGAPRTATSC